ncbi:VCBS repeat-containing protein [Candidatus Sumerlaeota bacterium]|nr:VCBS repeat-containing protein [Candidatus Sumerlaeota bacterium]
MFPLWFLNLILCIGLCVFSGFSFAQDVPLRRVEIDSALDGDGKALGDIDGDGLADIIVAGEQLAWYRAPGWAKTIVAGGVDFGTEIQVGDIDNDGDLDILAPDTLKKENVLWFENPRPPRAACHGTVAETRHRNSCGRGRSASP